MKPAYLKQEDLEELSFTRELNTWTKGIVVRIDAKFEGCPYSLAVEVETIPKYFQEICLNKLLCSIEESQDEFRMAIKQAQKLALTDKGKKILNGTH